MSTIAERQEAATVKLEGATEIMHDVAHGGPSVVVQTESGSVPSVAKWFADLSESVTGLPQLPARMSVVEGDLSTLKPTVGDLAAAVAAKAMKSEVNSVVADLVALKALNTSEHRWAYRVQHSNGSMDGGTFWRFDPASTAPVNDFTVVAPNNGAGRWLLNHGGLINVKSAGAKGDGATDDHAAISRAHANFPNIYYPPGNFMCSALVNQAAPFGFVGAGMDKTVVTFTGATQGYRITQSSVTDGVVFHDASIKTNLSNATNTGIIIDGSAMASGKDGAGHSILGERSAVRCQAYNLDFRGDTNSNGWGVGLNFKSCMNFAAENIGYRGVIPAVVGDLQGVGILVNGDGVPVDFSLRRLWIYYAKYSVLIPDYIEGGHIYDYEMVAVTYGIYGAHVPGVSVLPESACGCLAMYIDQGHINCLQKGIYLAKTNQSKVNNQNIYLQPRASDGPAIGVHMSYGSDNKSSNCWVSGIFAQNGTGNNTGMRLEGIARSNLSGFSADRVGSGALLISSTDNQITDISSSNSSFVLTGDGASIRNQVAGYKANGNSGAAISIAGDNYIEPRSYCATRIDALTAVASMTINVPIPVGTFSGRPNFGFMVPGNGGIGFEIKYDYDSSTATSAAFVVKPIAPATTLPTGNIRFAVKLEGN